MNEHSIASFLEATAQDEGTTGAFHLENPHLLEVQLDGRVWAKVGSMIGYTGEMRFTRQSLFEQGLDKVLTKMLTGEGASLMKAEGRGRLYLADKGKKVRILRLAGESLFVNGNDLLALEDGVAWDITMMRSIAGVLSAGLFNLRLSGNGLLALMTHHDPLTLRVKPGHAVFTDPNATVAWSGGLYPEFVTDLNLKTFLGRGSGEAIQMKFQGDGWVVLQPYEEQALQPRGR